MAVYTYVFDKNLWDWEIGGQTAEKPELKSVKDWCEQEKAELCFNLAIFTFANKKSCCEVVSKGKRVSYGCGDVSDIVYLNANNYCRGYSNGIKNGVVKVNKPMGGKRTRNGIGLTTSGNLIVAQSNSKEYESTFCNEVNKAVKNKGQAVQLFVMQDGGGSTSSYSNISKLDFNPEPDKKGVLRPIATVLCLRRKKTIALSHPIYAGCPKDISTELS